MSTPEKELPLTPNVPVFKNADDFTRWWLESLIYHADNTSLRRELIAVMGMRAVRCDCNETDCRGWKMVPAADRQHN